MSQPRGFKHVHTLKDGEEYRVYEGMIIVVHPDRPPRIVRDDGTEEEIELKGTVS